MTAQEASQPQQTTPQPTGSSAAQAAVSSKIPPGAYVNMVPPDRPPQPPQSPSKSPTFKFNVLLKSDIQQGNHSGQQVLVLSDSPENATKDIATYFGDDLASVEGPTIGGEPYVLASGQKAASSKGAKS